MTAQKPLKDQLRDILGPVVRQHGYKGSAPTWRRVTTSGDWAVLNVQSVSNAARQLECVVNTAVIPEPWLRWQRELLGPGMPKQVTTELGLFEDRLLLAGTPPESDRWWTVADEPSAEFVVQDMARQLEVRGFRDLERLLNREEMLAQIRTGELARRKRPKLPSFFAMAEAVMIMDAGPSDALNRQLEIAAEAAPPRKGRMLERFDAWVRLQARASQSEHSRPTA